MAKQKKHKAKPAAKPAKKSAAKPAKKSAKAVKQAAKKSAAKPAKPTAKPAKPAAQAKPAKATAKPAKATARPKPAAKPPKAAAKPKADGVGALRGAPLVERVIDKLRADGELPHPEPVPADVLARLRMPDGKPLPPSLRSLLAVDGSWLGVLEGDPPKLAFRSLTELVRQEFGDEVASFIADFERLLPGKCLLVPQGSDSRRFMYAGQPDDHGEYPVFVIDTDDVPWIGLAYPGLDVYLADGTVTEVMTANYTDASRHAVYGPMIVDQAKRNFRGFIGLALGGQDIEHVDGAAAATPVIAELFGHAPSEADLEEFG